MQRLLIVPNPANLQINKYLWNMNRIIFFLLIFQVSVSFGQARFDRVPDIPLTESGNQLRFPWAGGINFPWISSIDLNNDSLNDIFLYDHHNGRILTFLNNGSTVAELAWDYAPQYRFQFPSVNSWALLYDYNCDGKSDFFTLSSAFQCNGIAVYKNITTGNDLQWELVDSCLEELFVGIPQIIYANSVSLPHFNDIDGDGDMDILGYNSFNDGRVLYHKNLSMETFGSCDSLKFDFATACYGNFRFNIGGNNSVGAFHSPCRIGRPHFEQSEVCSPKSDSYIEASGFLPLTSDFKPSIDQSQAARRDDTVSSLYSIDVDGDGFQDLLVGDISAKNTLMIHSGGAEMDSQDTIYPSFDTPAYYNGFHYHSYLDTDNDGIKDLLVMPYDHENKNGIWLYKNSGTTASPDFSLATENFLQKNMLDVGEDACPVFFDYNNDSLLDIVISKAVFNEGTNSYETGLMLYKNVGTFTNPSFEFVTDDYAGLSATGVFLSPTYPAFGDLDGDGDKDMMIGREDGRLYYYQNVAALGAPASFTAPVVNYMGIDIGKYATPQFFDLNKDGLLDIICGGQRGFVNYFQNTGTASVASFTTMPTNDTLGCINLQATGTTDGFTVPFFYDSLGQTRLLVASENGLINQYDQIDGNIDGCFHLTGTVYAPSESSKIRFNITVSGSDINGDTLVDIVIGQSTGGAEIRYQHDPTIGISEYESVKPSFEIFPNPVNHELKVRFHDLKNLSSVLYVYNSLGELLLRKKVNDELMEINTGSFPGGIYFLQLNTEKYSFGKKFVVGH